MVTALGVQPGRPPATRTSRLPNLEAVNRSPYSKTVSENEGRGLFHVAHDFVCLFVQVQAREVGLALWPQEDPNAATPQTQKNETNRRPRESRPKGSGMGTTSFIWGSGPTDLVLFRIEDRRSDSCANSSPDELPDLPDTVPFPMADVAQCGCKCCPRHLGS